MDDMVMLEGDELDRFRAWLDMCAGARCLRVWIDPMDGAVKVKPDEGAWSPPMGYVVARHRG